MDDAKKYRVCYPRKGQNDKTFWPKIGRAVEGNDGKIKVYLDSWPTDKEWDGELMLFVDEKRDRDGF